MRSFKGLYRISLLPPIEAGQWNLQVKSDGNLTFNVLGTKIDFPEVPVLQLLLI